MTKLLSKKNQKGMTLVELLAVIVIIGVVAAIATVSIGGIIKNSKTKADASSVLMIKDAAEKWAIDSNVSAARTDVSISTELVTKGYLKEVPKEQATGNTWKTFDITIAANGTLEFAVDPATTP